MSTKWVSCPDCRGQGVIGWSEANRRDLPLDGARASGVSCPRCAGGGDISVIIPGESGDEDIGPGNVPASPTSLQRLAKVEERHWLRRLPPKHRKRVPTAIDLESAPGLPVRVKTERGYRDYLSRRGGR